jgi:hypothetical protein
MCFQSRVQSARRSFIVMPFTLHKSNRQGPGRVTRSERRGCKEVDQVKAGKQMGAAPTRARQLRAYADASAPSTSSTLFQHRPKPKKAAQPSPLHGVPPHVGPCKSRCCCGLCARGGRPHARRCSATATTGCRLHATAAPDHQGQGEGEHHAQRGPANLHDGGLALRWLGAEMGGGRERAKSDVGQEVGWCASRRPLLHTAGLPIALAWSCRCAGTAGTNMHKWRCHVAVANATRRGPHSYNG